jgi:hypothetical protein
MRYLALICCCALACVPQGQLKSPPAGNFYFPTGIVYSDSASSQKGVLYVANSNFDRRYTSGSVIAVALDGVGGGSTPLPPIGTANTGGVPLSITNLGSGISQVYIQSFAGEMTRYPKDGENMRLFVPARGDLNPLHVINATGPTLQCLDGSPDCTRSSPSLSTFEFVGNGKPRSEQPLGVGVGTMGDVMGNVMEGQVAVTQLQETDSPVLSGNNLESYLAVVKATTNPPFTVTPDNFISLGFFVDGNGRTTNSVAVGRRFAYATERFRDADGALLILVDGMNRGTFFDPGLQSSFRTLEARGVALNADESRLYIATRTPDSLLVLGILNPTSDVPTIRLLAAVPLPLGPSELAVIPRSGRGNLVAITSTTAGMVSIYDEDLGIITAQLAGVGVQPFGLAVQTAGQAARLFVTSFGDSRVAVIDIPDVNRPQQVQLVAFLGAPQTCLVEETDNSCLGTTP